MLATIAAVITLLSALVGLWAWWLKRKRAPTPEERKDDVRQQFQDSFRNVYELRIQGNHAEADAMLRRMSNTSTANILQHPAKSALSTPNPDRERLGSDSSQGDAGSHKP